MELGEDRKDSAEKETLQPIVIAETTLRQIIKDYVFHRQKYVDVSFGVKKMVWKSQYGRDIEIDLEHQPNTQESIGYELQD